MNPLKTKTLFRFFCISLVVIFFSFTDPYLIKRVSDANFRYEFYVTDKKVKPKSEKTYYWFKGGAIHNAQGGTAGELLDDAFTKMYHSNQLAEQGQFEKGLKIGLWKTWYPNGTLETTQYWSSGLKTGNFYRYDDKGVLIEKGYYKSHIKHGEWIDHIKKDTTVYKNGKVFVAPPKLTKEEKAKVKEDEKVAKAAKKAQEKLDKEKKALEKENKKKQKELDKQQKANQPQRVNQPQEQKESFFKRLFKKKEPKENTNGKGA